MEIRVTRPFIVSFITGDQYGGPGCFDNHAYMHCFTEINQIFYCWFTTCTVSVTYQHIFGFNYIISEKAHCVYLNVGILNKRINKKQSALSRALYTQV